MTDRVTLETPLGLDEVRRRLADRLMSPAGLTETLFRNAEALADLDAEKPEGIRFTGTVSEGSFQLIRWVPYGNSFRPGLSGSLRAGGRGTIIEMQVQSPPSWIAGIVASVLIALVIGFLWLSGIEVAFQPEMLIPVALCFVIVVVFSVAPKLEAQKAKRGIARVVGAARENG